MALHQGLYDLGVEARVYLAAKDGRGDVEAAANLALCQAVDVLRDIVCELAALARALESTLGREGVARDDPEVQEQRGDQRGDERSRGAEASLVHLGQSHAGVEERWELCE